MHIFLLGLSTHYEKRLSEAEKMYVKDSGEFFGKDKDSQFFIGWVEIRNLEVPFMIDALKNQHKRDLKKTIYSLSSIVLLLL